MTRISDRTDPPAPRPVRAARTAADPGCTGLPGSVTPVTEPGTPSSPHDAADGVVAGTALPAAGVTPGHEVALGRERAAPRAPAGAGGTDLPPAGTTALRGAEWRAAVAAATGKGRRRTPRATASVPAGPPADGARITASAHCIDRGCPWTAGPGDAGEVDKAAKAHTEKPPKHPTAVVAELVA